MTKLQTILSCALMLTFAACSDTVPDPVDGAVGDASRDASRDAMALDMSRVDMSMACPSGQHRCGTTCMEDQANTPDIGCSQGCGEACLAPPAHADASCSTEGACDLTCTGAWMRDGDHCSCAPSSCETTGAMCGTPDDGCGTPLNCGTCSGTATCMSGMCACAADAAEPNNSTGTAHDIGDFNDSPGVTMDVSFNVSSATDTDWFRADVDDAGLDGNPIIEVTLDGIPAGSNYDLAAFYACTGGAGDTSSCDTGSSDNTIGHGCASASGGSLGEAVTINTDCDHIGTDDDGTLFIRVTPAAWMNTCANYTLHIDVH